MPVKTFPAKELKNKIGSVLSVANREPVGITRNGHFSYVIVSANDWESIQENNANTYGKATLLKKPPQEKPPKKSWANMDAVGMWKNREDMNDVDTYVRNLRKPRFSSL